MQRSARLVAGTALLTVGLAIGVASVELFGPLFISQRTAALKESAPGEAAKAQRRILYYKNPMGHPDTSPVPKKDSMGMDYLPVYEGEDDDSGAVKVSADRIQKLGVRTEAAVIRALSRTIHATGTVQFHEARQVVVTARFDGWIEKLLVAQTGEPVRKGQALAEFYSFDLHRVQVEHFNTGTRMAAGPNQDLGPLYRLRNLGIAEEDIQRVLREGRANRTLPLRAPIDGIVVEKKATEGMRAAAGEVLYRIVDLSTVWIIADVYEQDLAEVAPGQDVEATLVAYPERRFAGKVTFIYPMVTAATRTARVRIELPNPDRALLLDMYASVTIAARNGEAPTLAIPDNAVIDSGARRVVLVEKSEGRFEPREIKTGRRGDGYVAVLDGLSDGEKVVVSANFLIDAESNLKVALRGLAKDTPGEEKKP
ncbi:MAG: efflux RND transporter periplasmic adaptor subunit [Usitatibacter sp.]